MSAPGTLVEFLGAVIVSAWQLIRPVMVKLGSHRRIEISKIEWEKVIWRVLTMRILQLNRFKGSFGSISSAATVAASSFDMIVTDPSILLAEVDQKLFATLRDQGKPSREEEEVTAQITYTEPATLENLAKTKGNSTEAEPAISTYSSIKSKVITLGDFIDTDQVGFQLIFIGYLLTVARWRQQILSCSATMIKTSVIIQWSTPILSFEARSGLDKMWS